MHTSPDSGTRSGQQETKPTPGPWTILLNQPNFVRAHSEETGKLEPVASVYHFNGELDANALLIAAAPDLLATLQATEKALTDLLLSRALDSTQQPFYTVRIQRDTISATIARATKGSA